MSQSKKKKSTKKAKATSYTVVEFDSDEEWAESRLGKITGTKAGDIKAKRDGGLKIGFYEILAERISVPASEENVMARGKRLEEYAVERFMEKTKKQVNTDKVLWVRKDNEDIAVSPDGSIGMTEAVECKCLSSARHVEGILTEEVPSEYWEQVLQYFVVNDSLEKLYFVFYDPRCSIDIFYITVKREDIQMQIDAQLDAERKALIRLKELEDQLTFDI